MSISVSNQFYVYVYLDPRKPGNFNYGKYHFEFEPFYVGVTKRSIEQRNKEHINNRTKLKSFMNKFLNKLINENYKIKPFILKKFNDKNEAFKLEIKLIKLIGRRDQNSGSLVNETDGGEGQNGVKWDNKRKLNFSKLMSRIPRTKEWNKNNSKALLGIKHKKERIIKNRISNSKFFYTVTDGKQIWNNILSIRTFCEEFNLNYNSFRKYKKYKNFKIIKKELK